MHHPLPQNAISMSNVAHSTTIRRHWVVACSKAPSTQVVSFRQHQLHVSALWNTFQHSSPLSMSRVHSVVTIDTYHARTTLVDVHLTHSGMAVNVKINAIKMHCAWITNGAATIHLDLFAPCQTSAKVRHTAHIH